jgi:hypothetical protein
MKAFASRRLLTGSDKDFDAYEAHVVMLPPPII